MKLVLKVHLVTLTDKVITMTPISDNTKDLFRLRGRERMSEGE